MSSLSISLAVAVTRTKLSLQKLDFYHATALGMGVRGVIKELGKVFRTTGSVEAYMLSLMMHIEFANLVVQRNAPTKKCSVMSVRIFF